MQSIFLASESEGDYGGGKFTRQSKFGEKGGFKKYCYAAATFSVFDRT